MRKNVCAKSVKMLFFNTFKTIELTKNKLEGGIYHTLQTGHIASSFKIHKNVIIGAE